MERDGKGQTVYRLKKGHSRRDDYSMQKAARTLSREEDVV